MGAILDALHRLQDLERQLSIYRSKEQAILRQTRSAQRLIDKTDADYQAHRQAVQQCQIGIDQADLDVKSREATIDKHRLALNAAKTNKEYAQILTALNTEKADASKTESRILELMSEKDRLTSQGKVFEEERSKAEARIAKYQQELARYQASVKEEVDQLIAQRNAASADIPPQALQTFERVAEHMDGEAMAEIVKLNSRSDDHLCGGCNMSVPLEIVNRLHTRDELVVCNSCGRILYVDTSSVRAG